MKQITLYVSDEVAVLVEELEKGKSVSLGRAAAFMDVSQGTVSHVALLLSQLSVNIEYRSDLTGTYILMHTEDDE